MNFFQNLLSSIMSRSRQGGYFRSKDFGILHEDINKALESVMSKSGEVSSLVYAEHLSHLIEGLDDEQFIDFFNVLKEKYDIDADSLSKASKEYSQNNTQKNLEIISKASKPKWIELFKRLNTVSEGTLRLVRLRERIRSLQKDNPNLAFFDSSLLDLFKHWFNPSFLVLQKIDWATPANILEKIIAYEAVHEINSWDDLRARLEPEDRRCFAFFHPLIPNEPLIFVEVALSNNMPESIKEVIKIDRSVTLDQDINTAAHQLKQEIEWLNRFATLSPSPGFTKWLKENSIDQNIQEDILLKQALVYLIDSDRTDGFPNDPVAKFHLGNGAIIERVNLNADLSVKGIEQSKGIMVNYLYDLDVLEQNHELFFKTKKVQLSSGIISLRKKLQIH